MTDISGDDWYVYAPKVCIGGDYNRNGNGDSGLNLVACVEGDNDNDV